MSDTIKVLKEMKFGILSWEGRHPTNEQENKAKQKIKAIDEALLALEQKEKLPVLLADFVLTLYKPNELILNDSLVGGKGKTKEQFIKKAEVFLNGRKD